MILHASSRSIVRCTRSFPLTTIFHSLKSVLSFLNKFGFGFYHSVEAQTVSQGFHFVEIPRVIVSKTSVFVLPAVMFHLVIQSNKEPCTILRRKPFDL